MGTACRTLRRRVAMSLVELMAAVLIVTILAASAYRGYQPYIEDAKNNRVQHDLETICNAIATYNRDHPTSRYARFELDDLKGRYLDELPGDPWGADYVVDPFLGRVVSRGYDGKLQTKVPGFWEQPDRQERSDDFAHPYTEQGLITYVTGQVLWSIQPDGHGREAMLEGIPAGATAYPAPDRNRILVSSGGKILLYSRVVDGQSYDGSPKFSFKKRELSLARPPPLPPLTAGREANWSPDGLKFAFVCTPDGVAIGDVTTSVPAVVVTSAVDAPLAPTLLKGNREVVFGDAALNIYRASAAEASQLTTMNVKTDGTSENDGARPAVSPDGKLVAYLSNPGGGDILVRTTGEARRPQVIARGSYQEVAFGPNGQLIAASTGQQISVISVKPTDTSSGGALLVIDSAEPISSLSWR